jgi:hypothetical protein
MDDSFLAEQLRRIRQMSEQMSQARARLVQSSDWDDTSSVPDERPEHGTENGRRTSDVSPLQSIRDCRTYDTQNYKYDAARKSSTRERNDPSHPSRRRRHR